jgi:hypothetical protein
VTAAAQHAMYVAAKPKSYRTPRRSVLRDSTLVTLNFVEMAKDWPALILASLNTIMLEKIMADPHLSDCT